MKKNNAMMRFSHRMKKEMKSKKNIWSGFEPSNVIPKNATEL